MPKISKAKILPSPGKGWIKSWEWVPVPKDVTLPAWAKGKRRVKVEVWIKAPTKKGAKPPKPIPSKILEGERKRLVSKFKSDNDRLKVENKKLREQLKKLRDEIERLKKLKIIDTGLSRKPPGKLSDYGGDSYGGEPIAEVRSDQSDLIRIIKYEMKEALEIDDPDELLRYPGRAHEKQKDIYRIQSLNYPERYPISPLPEQRQAHLDIDQWLRDMQLLVSVAVHRSTVSNLDGSVDGMIRFKTGDDPWKGIYPHVSTLTDYPDRRLYLSLGAVFKGKRDHLPERPWMQISNFAEVLLRRLGYRDKRHAAMDCFALEELKKEMAKFDMFPADYVFALHWNPLGKYPDRYTEER